VTSIWNHPLITKSTISYNACFISYVSVDNYNIVAPFYHNFKLWHSKCWIMYVLTRIEVTYCLILYLKEVQSAPRSIYLFPYTLSDAYTLPAFLHSWPYWVGIWVPLLRSYIAHSFYKASCIIITMTILFSWISIGCRCKKGVDFFPFCATTQ